MKILIAEDDLLMVKMLEYRLKIDRHEVIVTRDGREALQKVDEFHPDLIITDIMMPFTSGLELVRSVKARYSSIPIIVLSGLGQEDVVIEAFELGADDYMTKPFSPNELTVRVRRFMNRAQARLAG